MHGFLRALIRIIVLLGVISTPVSAGADFAAERRDMVRTIEQSVRETSARLDRQRLDQRVMEVMGKVERHAFVPARQRGDAYANRPLPIGHGQTISQPYMVAVMTDLLKPAPEHRVLEVGTGSAYQAAVLAELVGRVYTMEIVEPLATQARERLKRLGYDNVEVRHGDGYHGWPEHAPFDSIIVTAAADHVPPPLLRQLRPGGRMVIPVGSRFLVQQLVLIEKNDDGTIITRQLLPVSFVPLTGDH